MEQSHVAQWEELTSKSIDEQAKYFLRSFVLEFQGSFEQVLDLAEEFKKFAPNSGTAVRELDEFSCHRFLEARGETLTVKELREYMKDLDLDDNHNVAFVEYALFRWKKTVKELFTPPKGGVTQAMLDRLDAAISSYQEALEVKAKREARMDQLREVASRGGVKGMAAKNELEQMQKEDLLEQRRKEITSAAQKRLAQKAIDNADGTQEREAALAAEEARLAAEAAKQKEAEEKARRDSRRRLADRAKLWE